MNGDTGRGGVHTPRPTPRIVILVPYTPANDRHRWLYDMIRPELERFGWPIIEGTCEGPWSRAPAVNDAARKAAPWDIAFLADCDTIPDHAGILRAVDWVSATRGGARPHGERYMLTQEGSLAAVQRGVENLEPGHFERRQWAGGGLDVIHRDAWETVGGMDERYIGWGYEDSEFHVQLIAHSRWDRLPGEAWHLWHPHAGKARTESLAMYNQTKRKHAAALNAWARNQGLRNPMAVM